MNIDCCFRRRRIRRLDLRALEELYTKTQEDILIRLGSDGGGLDELLTYHSLDENRILLLLKLIGKTFTPQMMQFCYGNIKSIVEKMLVADAIFLNLTLYQFLLHKRSEAEEIEIARSTLALVNTVMMISPCFAMPKVVQFEQILSEKIRPIGDDTLKAHLERFQAALKRKQEQDGHSAGTDHHGNARSRGMRLNEDTDQPDETFRALPLIPTQQDLTSDEHIFVRRNRDNGSYATLEDYLDIQFRLFRADFIIPLRESIEKFMGTHDAENRRDSNRGVRVYRDVQIVRPVCSDKDLSYRLSFDVSRFSNVNWRNSQRLKYGSLLCLSSDGFQNYLCAVVSFEV